MRFLPFLRSQVMKLAGYPVYLRVLLFLLTLLLVWLPWSMLCWGLLRRDVNLLTIASMGGLFVLFLVLQSYWQPWSYGKSAGWIRWGLSLEPTQFRECIVGLIVGVGLVVGIYLFEARLGWIDIRPPTEQFLVIAGQGALSGLGVALAEEIVFRGWLLTELERDFPQSLASQASAVLFALLHYLKPWSEIQRTWPGFPTLILLGLILVRLKRLTANRLGLPIGFHAGLVWGYYCLSIGELISTTPGTPDWLVGIHGNPLASLIGITVFGLIYGCIQLVKKPV
ncbi:MAG: CPBP family intramembrane glutamic endopeptidase [Cyanobacteria bacterium P01_H01_bin.15]